MAVDAHRRLAAAIIKCAVVDAQSTNGRAAEARRWLAHDPWARFLLDALDLDLDRLQCWLDKLELLAQLELPMEM